MKYLKYAIIILLLSNKLYALNSQDITTVSIDRPLWTLGYDDASWLIPEKNIKSISFAIFSFSADQYNIPEKESQEKETDVGRVTRSLPLYIGERINIETDCKAVNYNPVLNNVGPILSSKKWDPKDLIKIFQPNLPDYIIHGHFNKNFYNIRRNIIIYLFNTKTNKNELIIEESSFFNSYEEIAADISENFLNKLFNRCKCHQVKSNYRFIRPTAKYASKYLIGLGQLFMQMLADNKQVPRESLWGEDNMLQWYWNLYNNIPDSDSPKLIYMKGIIASINYGGKAYKKHIDNFTNLLIEINDVNDPLNKLSPYYFKKIKDLINYRNKLKLLNNTNDKNYKQWLNKLKY